MPAKFRSLAASSARDASRLCIFFVDTANVTTILKHRPNFTGVLLFSLVKFRLFVLYLIVMFSF